MLRPSPATDSGRVLQFCTLASPQPGRAGSPSRWGLHTCVGSRPGGVLASDCLVTVASGGPHQARGSGQREAGQLGNRPHGYPPKGPQLWPLRELLGVRLPLPSLRVQPPSAGPRAPGRLLWPRGAVGTCEGGGQTGGPWEAENSCLQHERLPVSPLWSRRQCWGPTGVLPERPTPPTPLRCGRGRPGAWLFPSGEAGPREAAAPRFVHRPCPATLGAQLPGGGGVGVGGARPEAFKLCWAPQPNLHPSSLSGWTQAWWHCSPGDQGPSGQVSPLPPPQGTPGPPGSLSLRPSAPTHPVLLEGPVLVLLPGLFSFFLATPRVIWGLSSPIRG